MARQSQGSMSSIAGISIGVFVAALAVLMVVGEYGFAAALFLALILGAAVGGFLYWAFRGGPMEDLFPKSVARPSEKTEEAAAEDTRTAARPGSERDPAEKATPPVETEPRDPVPAPAPSPSTASTASTSAPADRPEQLDAPKGKADDLKKIKGVGPKLESLLNGMGFFHYSQIASWSETEVAWVDQNLEGFKGRVTRDGWVEQARLLADGGDTEFSKRVDGGDVY